MSRGRRAPAKPVPLCRGGGRGGGVSRCHFLPARGWRRARRGRRGRSAARRHLGDLHVTVRPRQRIGPVRRGRARRRRAGPWGDPHPHPHRGRGWAGRRPKVTRVTLAAVAGGSGPGLAVDGAGGRGAPPVAWPVLSRPTPCPVPAPAGQRSRPQAARPGVASARGPAAAGTGRRLQVVPVFTSSSPACPCSLTAGPFSSGEL